MGLQTVERVYLWLFRLLLELFFFYWLAFSSLDIIRAFALSYCIWCLSFFTEPRCSVTVALWCLGDTMFSCSFLGYLESFVVHLDLMTNFSISARKSCKICRIFSESVDSLCRRNLNSLKSWNVSCVAPLHFFISSLGSLIGVCFTIIGVCLFHLLC